ncbi:MAG TPA: hypothetical protein PLX89_19800 [Verrucomicrobiota bacterium]|nr:hypothetical protein [Verrucomicrobiota bacterium]
MLNAGWFQPELREYLAPNFVAEAARDLGVTDDRVRLALAHAAVREGRQVGRWEIAAEVGARAADLEAAMLLARAQSPEVAARCKTTTAEFHALQVSQRPTFLLESSIGDRAVFSGIWALAPLQITLETMAADAAAYTTHGAHFGGPPPE